MITSMLEQSIVNKSNHGLNIRKSNRKYKKSNRPIPYGGAETKHALLAKQ